MAIDYAVGDVVLRLVQDESGDVSLVAAAEDGEVLGTVLLLRTDGVVNRGRINSALEDAGFSADVDGLLEVAPKVEE